MTALAASRRLRVGFTMELVLGHVTWYQNLRGAVEQLDQVDSRWIETTLYDEHGLLERTPGVPGFVRAGARAWLDLHRGLRGWSPDVLVFNTQKAAMLCQLDMVRRPSILMTDVTPLQYDRMADLYDHVTDESGVVRSAKHAVNVLNFRLASAAVVCSTWVRDSLIDEYGMRPENVHVIPIGIDTDYWQPDHTRRGEPGAKPKLLFVGGHFERKGGRELLETFRALRLADRAELHVVTRSDLAPEPGVVVHRDVQNNSPRLLHLYQQADIFVLPTLADCFSNASLEAMGTGLPVITTAMGGIPDIVDHGATGFLLQPGDVAGLTEAVRRLVDEPATRTAFGAASRQRAVARFDARTNAAQILALSAELVSRRKREPAAAEATAPARAPQHSNPR